MEIVKKRRSIIQARIKFSWKYGILINPCFMKKIGIDKTYVEIYIDHRENKIGLKFIDHRTPDAYKLTINKTNLCGKISWKPTLDVVKKDHISYEFVDDKWIFQFEKRSPFNYQL